MTSNFIENLLKMELCFSYPQRLTASAWHGHIPFALALISMLRPRTIVELGTFQGDAYCAFCQAVAALDLNCRCAAVDTWEGDIHGGFYSPDILEELRGYHDAKYGHFSTLLQMTFDEARNRFEPQSIDMLHIDGLHTYEACRHDFDSWLPSMSSRGVVLLHDTQVKEDGFGVGRLLAELDATYPVFEFEHSFGLGIVGVGCDMPSPVEALFRMDEEEKAWVRQLFAYLGNHIVIHNAVLKVEEHFDAPLGDLISLGERLKNKGKTGRGALEAAIKDGDNPEKAKKWPWPWLR